MNDEQRRRQPERALVAALLTYAGRRAADPHPPPWDVEKTTAWAIGDAIAFDEVRRALGTYDRDHEPRPYHRLADFDLLDDDTRQNIWDALHGREDREVSRGKSEGMTSDGECPACGGALRVETTRTAIGHGLDAQKTTRTTCTQCGLIGEVSRGK